MRRLLELCLRWRVLVLAAAVMIAALGVRAALRLPIDAVPDVTNVQVQILTDAPSLGPLEIERNVTFPVEAAMSGLPDLKEIRSVTRYGLSAVTVVFEDGTDLLRSRQLVSERLVEARARIPEGVGTPQLGPMSTGMGEILQFELRSDAGHSPMELRTILDWFVSYQLRSVPGVVEVNAFGGELQTYEVAVDPERLRAFGLSLGDLFRALEQNNRAVGGGSIARGGEQLLVRGEARLTSISDVENVVVATSAEGVSVRVRDLGRVRLAPMLRQGAVTRDGRGEIVSAIVMMLIGENSRAVVEAVKQRIEQLRPALPQGVTIEVFYDRAELVDRTILTVAENLGLGALFVIGVLVIVLGSLRAGLVVALAIPFSLLVAFVGMDLVGVSGNLMSLGAVDFGVVVDGSIIVVENALVHLAAAARGQARPLSYAEASKAVVTGALEVRRAAVFGELIIVLVYVPILTLSGMEGRMFVPMAVTVLFALLGAFVASLTFVPVLAATFLRDHLPREETWVVRRAHLLYAPLLRATMRHPRLVAGGALALFVATGIVAANMGAEFVPRLEEGALAVQIVRLPSVSLEESVAGATRFEEVARTFPEVVSVVTKTGRPEIATDPMGIELSDAMLTLLPRSEWTTASTREGLVAAMRERFELELPGLGLSFSQPIELRVAELVSGTRSDVAITVYGDDLAELSRISGEVQRSVREIDGATDVRGEQLHGMPTLQVTLDRQESARYGVSAEDAMDAIEAVGGRPVGEVFEGERRFPLQVRFPEEMRTDVERLRRVPVRGTAGRLLPLGQVARLEEIDSPASISREAVRRRTSVEVNVRGRDVASFVAEAREALRGAVDLPDGYVVEWGGQFENLESATERLAFAVPLALALIFVLLYAAFGEAKAALLVYLDVPFAAVGGVLLLAARGMPLSISAAVGFIALAGIAVLNGVVLLSKIKSLRREGLSPEDAAARAAESRLRAVVTTATVAALGFLPMALSTGDGAEVQRPLATVVVGGLLSATALTLLVLPTLYARAYRGAPAPTPSIPPPP